MPGLRDSLLIAAAVALAAAPVSLLLRPAEAGASKPQVKGLTR